MPIVEGLLSEAKQSPTSHFNQRPSGMTINLLVIHNISLPAGYFSGTCVQELFCGNLDTTYDPSFDELKNVRVSSHLFIRRNAQVIQFVNFNQRAWHAGESSYKGHCNCNDFSIGIELEGSDFVPFTERQYKKLASVTSQIMASYPLITLDNICGHSDIAPDRKTDPGPLFNWNKYKNSLSRAEPNLK